MLIASTCYSFNKLTNARTQSNSFSFLLNYNVSLSSSCLIFRKIKRGSSQVFGVRLDVPLPRCTRHARMYKALLISLMPRLGEQVFFLNSRDVQCLKSCWFDGGTVILFLRINCPTLKGMEQKTPSDSGIQPECPKKRDGMAKHRSENFALLLIGKF